MRKPTPSEIKQSGVLGEHFFSRNTLRFFGQSISMFKTEWTCRKAGVVRLYAPYFDRRGNPIGVTERWVKVDGDRIRGTFIWDEEQQS